MLKIQEIREIIKLIDQSSIDEFLYENDGVKVKLRKRGQEGETIVQKVVQEKEVQPVQKVITETPQQAAAPSEKQEAVKEEPKNVDTENLHKITSPMVGTFYAAPNPDADPYVKVGSKVEENTVVCIVEAMKLFNEIEADVKGEIVEVLVENGQLVEYGQPLFLVKPE
ncbi:acetyl-CoA carboxylase biotin carboxyl carrier protein [Bacillus alveayuensis]|jgi:acetyl-CoA carboxylase biotin carboxyl carrier protein|uniref:Biotin carboxyl carrier protein of acetyl-CoA carboxylase n=1 Tax=Aeribacillus alveayuensis TaxID=279215 RepID=A0ABT9VK98_9BACI|nr:acetyl-CoA carboxylase biotin carboxyl carrier protein [Bacillus alveayuensis]MDQ0161393.1 acetyl-CoA carboxylase biotin carboxyl carrier protein [Bacillus alveayuensis]